MFRISEICAKLIPRFQRTYSSSSLSRQARILGKFVNPGKKRRWHDNGLPSVTKLSNPIGQPGKTAKKRVSVLNKVFMKYITDLMATGSSVSDEIHGRGIEISKVNVTADFNIVNVYWLSKSDKYDAEMEKVLKSIAGRLRHELSQLKVIGVVPNIAFVKDQELARQRKLDQLLTIADYGEDYTPSNTGDILKTEFTSTTTIPASVQAQIRELDKLEYVEEEPLPEMTNYIYGLDHEKIMGRIISSLNVSKAAWDRNGNEVIPVPESSSRQSQISDEISSSISSQNLSEFLRRRQLLEMELMKQLSADKEYEKELAQKYNMDNDDKDQGYYDGDDSWLDSFDNEEEIS